MIHIIKGTLSVLALIAVLWLGWSQYSDFLTKGSRPPNGTQILNDIEAEGVPRFAIRDINGNELGNDDYLGKVLILNFWASWCDPCVEEFPSLLKLLADFKGKVKLVAISADYTLDDLQSFLKAFKAKSPHLNVVWDKDQKMAKNFGTSVLPESFIVGTNGKLVRKVAGVDDWSSKNAREYFASLLSKTGTSEKTK